MPDVVAITRRSAAWLWSKRRWAYGAYMAVGVFAIPARTRFHFRPLRCDARLTEANVTAALSKGPHVILFAFFFLLTAAQFDTIDRRSLSWSFAATVGLGFLVEIEEGLTRTGNCRYTDVLPDIVGGLIVMALLMILEMSWRRWHRDTASKPEAV